MELEKTVTIISVFQTKQSKVVHFVGKKKTKEEIESALCDYFIEKEKQNSIERIQQLLNSYSMNSWNIRKKKLVQEQ